MLLPDPKLEAIQKPFCLAALDFPNREVKISSQGIGVIAAFDPIDLEFGFIFKCEGR